MFIRKIGKFLRGKATAFQIISATLLGGLLGSLPGISHGPLLVILLLFLLIILNANLFLGGLTLLMVKLVTLILLPVYFQIGMSLLEGGLGRAVAGLVNAPVTAWFGLEYYVMIPSLLIGGLIGLLVGITLHRSLKRFRRTMAGLETGSEKYQAYASRFWVKALAWLFVGGLKGKKSWSELDDLKGGLPVRPVGIVLVICLMVLGYVGVKLLDATIVTSTVQGALERANGATVDIRQIKIQPAQNRVTVSGLAMADPEALDTNRFESGEIIADISGMSLLAKKVVIDSLQVLQPATGTARKIPGRRILKLPEPAEEKEMETGTVNIDDFLGQAAVLRDRLRVIKRAYDRIAPIVQRDDAEAAEADQLSWREQLVMRAKEEGYANIKSDSLIRNSPRLWIREFKTDNLVVTGSSDVYRVEGANLSTQPALLKERGMLEIQRADGHLRLGLTLPSKESPGRSLLNVRYMELSIPGLEQQAGRDLPVKGGTMDIEGEGMIDNGLLDLPLRVVLKNTTLTAMGTSLPIEELPLEVSVTGTLDRPVLRVPMDLINQVIQDGARREVENLIEEKAGGKLKGLLPFGG